MSAERREVVIDGLSLSIQDVVDVARRRLPVRLSPDAVQRDLDPREIFSLNALRCVSFRRT